MTSDLIPKSEDVRLACAFIADGDKRAAVLALFALLETVRDIPERVTEPLLGEIRLRWWCEGFEAIRDGRAPHYHPLIVYFQSLMTELDLPVADFLDLLEGQMPLLDKAPLTVATALGVVDKGEGTLGRLAVRILGQDGDVSAPMRLYGLAGLKARGRLEGAGETELSHLLRDARRAARRLHTDLMPLALPATLAEGLWRGRPAGPLAKRLKLTWSYMTGRL